ncbi:MAG: hypothetical protein ACHQIK_17195 [Candidatus Acidiferrales bacterium]
MSKTPAEALKENFWIGAKGGLLDLKHYLKMRESVWLFFYLLRNQTSLNQAGEGVVNYGHPLTLEYISTDLKGVPIRTLRRWAIRLKREGYIYSENHGHKGLTFWIAKGKAKTRKVKVTYEEARSMLAPRPQMAAEKVSLWPNAATEQPAPRPFCATEQVAELPQSLDALVDAGKKISSIPKGITPKNLSYYNKDAAAQNAALPIPPFKKLAREKTMPRPMNQAEVDERRRFLLRQGEELERKYPPKEQPGKEAIA